MANKDKTTELSRMQGAQSQKGARVSSVPIKPQQHVLDALRQAFSYDPTTGHIIWVRPPKGGGNARFLGTIAGTVHSHGYIQIGCGGLLFKGHHVAWFLHYGEWPPLAPDHRNGVGTDNRIDNLRLSTGSENSYNSKIPTTNTSGVRGVSWDKRRGKWLAQIAYDRRNRNLGRYDTMEEAIAVRLKAERRYHGEFAASNRPS